jgi:Flp pilus assembly protein TadD
MSDRSEMGTAGQVERLKSFKIAAVLVVAAAGAQSFGQSDADMQQQRHEFRGRVIRAADLYKQGDTDRSLADFQRLYDQDPHDANVEGWLGFLLLVKGRGSEAVAMLEDASHQRPNDLEVADNLGNAYYAAGMYDKALATYQHVISEDGTLFVPHYNSGNIYLRREDYVHALVEYRRAATMKADDPAIENDLGICYEKLKDDRNAAMAFMKASDLQPTNAIYGRNAGLALIRADRATEAGQYLQRADPADPSVGIAMADSYVHSGDNAKALQAYENVRGSMGDNAAFWFNLGVMRSAAHDYRGAEDAYRKALSISPNDLDSLTNLGLLLFRRGDYREAETVFDKLSGLNPDSVDAKMDLGSAAAKAGDTDKAASAWASALRSNPSDVRMRIALGDLKLQNGDAPGAEMQYRRVLHSDPNNARALNGLGLIYLKHSSLASAEAAFRSSLQSDPHYIPAYNNLAITMERQNHRPQAIAVLQKAMQLDPQDASIQKTMQRLKGEG